ncbi:MAG: hypothetical protein HC841_06460, partial [Verrucomicrobiae bacterium]|nr:hypothetical protein [Verrucomicrobiae bacterium]
VHDEVAKYLRFVTELERVNIFSVVLIFFAVRYGALQDGAIGHSCLFCMPFSQLRTWCIYSCYEGFFLRSAFLLLAGFWGGGFFGGAPGLLGGPPGVEVG